MQWNLIPQFFYDMIGRFCPGAIVMATAWIVWEGPGKVITLILTITNDLPFFAYVILVLAAYLIADMLYQLWCKLFPNKSGGEDCFSHWLELRASLLNWKSICDKKIDGLPEKYIMLDYLRTHKPSEAVRLLKLKAECRMSKVIVIGYFLLGIFNLFIMLLVSSTHIETIQRGMLEIFLFLCAWLSYYREKNSKKHFENGVTIAWLMRVFDEKENPVGSNDRKDTPDGN